MILRNENKSLGKLSVSGLIVLLFTLDQITKYLIANSVNIGEVVFSKWGFGLTYVINRGFTFHLFEQYEATIPISIILKILCFFGITLAYRFYKTKYRSNRLIAFSFIFIIATFLGNVWDQIILGYARDFIIWPGPGTPNLADIYSKIALILLFIELFKNPETDLNFSFDKNTLKKEYGVLKEFVKFARDEIKLLFRKIVGTLSE